MDTGSMEGTGKIGILDLPAAELEGLLRGMDAPAFRAKQIGEWVYRRLVFDFQGMTNLPKTLRDRLEGAAYVQPLTLVAESVSEDGLTRKGLFRLRDGNTVESVLMLYPRKREGKSVSPRHPSGDKHLPHSVAALRRSPESFGPPQSGKYKPPNYVVGGEGDVMGKEGRARQTVCVSTQAGCGMGCAFCATGQEGLRRNLTAGEIVGQVLFFAQRLAQAGQEGVTNVVLMGQGEPLANLQHVSKGIEILNSPNGFNLGARHMTISTVGLVPQIREIATRYPQIGLAVSLHAPDDGLRSRLVPMNRKYSIDSLMAACREYVELTHRRVTFEYAMIAGVNDGLAQAGELGKLLKGLLCHVNLIPLNAVAGSHLKPSPKERVQAFQAELEKRGIPTTVRARRGTHIDAACGQLRGKESRS